MRRTLAKVPIALGCCLVALVPAARAEIIDEIVAWVNGDVITFSDLQNEEQLMIAEAYRQFTGEELDKYVENVRQNLLLNMIDSKILVDRARTLFDLDKMRAALYDNFRKQQNIQDEAEFERMLAKEGLTVEAMKQRLLEMYAPEEVLDFEVGGRVAVSEQEVQEFYESRRELFTVPGSVEIREIVLLAEGEDERRNRRAEAAAIRERAAAAEDFGAVATEVSEAGTASKGGELGPLEKGDLSEELEQVAFSLPVGAVSDALEMPYGFHIIKVEARTEDTLQPLGDVSDRLRSALEDQRNAQQRNEYMKKARENAEWCVKPKFRNRLSVTSPECTSL